MHSGLRLELLDTLRHSKNYHTSPRIKHLAYALQDNHTEMELMRAIVSHYIELDNAILELTEELIEARRWSAKPIIMPSDPNFLG